MMERYFAEVWSILLELGWPLLMGILIAGAIHVLLPQGFVHRNFGGRGFKSIFKATLIGVPMPLCSCAVIPTAIGLKQDGASNGASTSFLISTPQTGVDSILVNAAFLGWPFAIFKVVVAFITGIIGGIFVDLFERPQDKPSYIHSARKETIGYRSRLKEALSFGIIELLGMIYWWIILGIFLAALISVLIPPGSLANIGWISGIGGLFLMLIIALPLYVCATGSVPIAASLIAAGMAPGTALVFLMAGPASNIATIGAIFRAFGGRVLAIYLITVAVFSLLFGWLFDFIINAEQTRFIHQHHSTNWFSIITALILIGLLLFLVIWNLYRKFTIGISNAGEAKILTLNIEGMTCQHCAMNVTKALKAVPGVVSVKVLLDKNLAYVDGAVDTVKLIESVTKAGYRAETASK